MKKIIFFILLLVLLFAIWFVTNDRKSEFSCPGKTDGTVCYADLCNKGFWGIFKNQKCVMLGQCLKSECVSYEKYKESRQELVKNDYLEIMIPKDGSWNYQESGKGVLDLKKEGYVLHIDPSAAQASGVEGGRFSEIAQGTAADLVLKMHPAEPCGSLERISINDKLDMTSYYMSPENVGQDFCNTPKDGGTHWYFSFAATRKSGYFGDLSIFGVDGEPGIRQFVVTVTYEASEIDKLPLKDSPQRLLIMREVKDMLKTLKFK
jgi:hypothetical protein